MNDMEQTSQGGQRGQTAARPSERNPALILAAALSIAAWITTGLYLLYISRVLSPACHPGGGCEPVYEAFWTLISLIGLSMFLTFIAPLWALGVALHIGDRIGAAAFGVLLAGAAFATYALWHPGHQGLAAAVYGFPPDMLSAHPVAYYGSAALVLSLPFVVLAYALTPGRARRVSAAAGSLLVLIAWVAFRVAG